MKKRIMTLVCRFRTKSYWKRGSGELIGFVCLLPLIMLLLCAMISAAHIGFVNQQLNYTAYNSCRSAVVSDTFAIAETRAMQVYNSNMGTENADKYGYESCTLEIISGSSWGKGVYVKCTVRYYVDTFMPFTSGVREQSIVMMVENGDVSP